MCPASEILAQVQLIQSSQLVGLLLFAGMTSPSGHQKSLEETMSELRMASSWPSWMTQPRPKQASAVIQSTPPRSLPDPKRMRWTQAAPEIELAHSPESPTTAMTQAAPQAGEPKTSILDELLGTAAPTSALTVAPASLAGVAESGPQASVPKLASTSAGSAESGAQAAAPAAASPQEDPKEVLKLIESEVDLMARECPT